MEEKNKQKITGGLKFFSWALISEIQKTRMQHSLCFKFTFSFNLLSAFCALKIWSVVMQSLDSVIWRK